MPNKVFRDLGSLDFKSEDGRKNVFGAVQHFFKRSEQELRLANKTQIETVGSALSAITEKARQSGSLQHFATSGDFPDTILDRLNKVHATDMVDLGWQEGFNLIDISSSRRRGITVDDVEGGLSFKIVKEGEKAQVYKFGGSATTVTVDMYGGGLGWSRTLIDDLEYWTIEDNTIQFNNKWQSDYSTTHYELIEAGRTGSSFTNISWQAPVPSGLASTDPNYAAVRDMRTIEKAAETIMLAVKDKGYGVTMQSQFVLFAPIQLRSRILRALGILNANLSGSFPGVQFNVIPVFTTMFKASNYATHWYMTVRGGARRNIALNRMPLTVFPKFDEASYSDVAYGWGRYGAAIVDTDLWVSGDTA